MFTAGLADFAATMPFLACGTVMLLPMQKTELARRFTDSFRLQEVLHPDEYEGYERSADANDPFEAAAGILQAQAATRAISEFERLLNAPGPGQDFFDHEENVGLALALFITARAKGGDVELRNGQVVIGDRLEDITRVSIEVTARRGDFDIDFLISWDELGPHPEWYAGADETVPHTLEVHKELALIRDDVPGSSSPSDRKTRRAGLTSLRLLVMSFERAEAERDPFGLAKRALGDLRRAAFEPFIP